MRIAIISVPIAICILKSIFKAIAPPKSSARVVETEAMVAVDNIDRDAHLFMCRVQASDRQRPVAIPKCATLCCRTINMMVESVTIQSNWYPNPEPAARLLAQFRGR